MGFLDKLNPLSGDDEEEFVEDFDEEFEDDFDEEFEDDAEDVEEEVKEWDNAYEFSKEVVTEVYGFSDMGEFVAKAAVLRMNKSNRYRDRIAMGKETMEMVTDTVEMSNSIGSGGATDWEEAAKQLEGAATVKEKMDEMVDKEERMVNEFLGLAREGIEIARDRTDIGSDDVDTGIRRSDDDI